VLRRRMCRRVALLLGGDGGRNREG
jgi:hypothetical protein